MLASEAVTPLPFANDKKKKKKNKKYDNWLLPRESDRVPSVAGKKEEGREDSIVDRENPPLTAEDVVPPSICRKLSKNGKLIPEKR